MGIINNMRRHSVMNLMLEKCNAIFYDDSFYYYKYVDSVFNVKPLSENDVFLDLLKTNVAHNSPYDPLKLPCGTFRSIDSRMEFLVKLLEIEEFRAAYDYILISVFDVSSHKSIYADHDLCYNEFKTKKYGFISIKTHLYCLFDIYKNDDDIKKDNIINIATKEIYKDNFVVDMFMRVISNNEDLFRNSSHILQFLRKHVR